MHPERFEARLEPAGERTDAKLVRLPASVVAALGGGRARIPVRLEIGGVEYRGSTMPVGDGAHCVGIPRAVRARAGVSEAAPFALEIARDDAPRNVEVPAELAAALEADGLRATFDGLSYTQRKEHARDVVDAKRSETRERRLAKIVAEVRERSASDR